MEQKKKRIVAVLELPPPPSASPYGESNYLPHRDKKDYEKSKLR